MSSSAFKQFLVHEGRGRNTPCVVAIITITCGLSVLTFIFGFHELWQLNEVIEAQCQVNSSDVGFSGGSLWRAFWKVQILNDQNKQIEEGEVTIKSYSSYFTESGARDAAQKRKANEIYPCYKYRDHPLGSMWSWRWKKPSKLKAFLILSSGLVLLISGCVLYILRRVYKAQATGQTEIGITERLDLET
ncbi:unnamed protein product [Adineta ricciae]|uniref:Uncharacterized protein n=1 Tax=Adineta ricciae TaxID=249248 RepID=A0A814NUU4_ADIRI|nr:unnamed protein product [Adineta ricciae]CAF1145482.1 unnamed protein product [Adineta ricciae]